MEVSSGGKFLCLGGPHYSHYLLDTLLRLEKESRANYFKFDGIQFTCNRLDNGYPVGVYSRAAAVRNWIRILEALHAANPHALLGLSTGPWRSPWWLRYADTVDYGGADHGYMSAVPSPTSRQANISYNAYVLYHVYRVDESQFPMSSLDAAGVYLVNNRQDQSMSLSDWKDSLIDFMGTGVMKVDLYITSEILTSEQWDVLGRALKYMKVNAHPLYDNSTFVLGDPSQRESYGYLHYSQRKTILVLRNPFIRPTTVRLRLDQQSGFQQNDGTFQAEVVYPYREFLRRTFKYGDILELHLTGYEQCVIELHPFDETGLRVAGVRFSLNHQGETNRVDFRLYGAEGATIPVELPHREALKEVSVNGAQVKLSPDEGKITIPVHFGEANVREDQPAFSVAAVNLTGAEGTSRGLTVSTTLHIPSDFEQSQLVVLLEPTRPMSGVITVAHMTSGIAQVSGVTATARLNGKPNSFTTVNSGQFGARGAWYWFQMGLKPGSNSVDMAIHLSAETSGGLKVSGWLRSERLLVEKDLSLVFGPGQALASPSDNILPDTTRIEKQTFLIFGKEFY